MSLIRRLAAVALALGISAGTAAAADLGGAPPRRDYVPLSPRLDLERWTGFYLGGSIANSFGATGYDSAIGAGDLDAKGWNGSIHAGYNWQIGRGVIGLEADLGTGSFGGTTTLGGSLVAMDTKAFGSLRARAGILVAPNLLVYGTGGFAWANMNLALDGHEVRQTFTGYQVGLGTELMLQPNWTLRLEYLYTDLGRADVSLGGISNSFDPTYHTLRAGLSLKF